ncbi:ferritin-like domain-containing protein [Pseudarthrobacter sp. MM222]|uniref:ferritin-like domain-containing protein n=1 Tax=Pseudarthrobacter sp. MM222 TaxID=3018929 RepID=UPI002220F98F|nr:ferritin-like domain-containing protein [Pseudarthrobacter sp. MM222]
MKDDTGEKRLGWLTPRFLLRFALLACIALVVVGLGVALTPGNPKQPGEPPFSERARTAALTETLRLRAAGEHLGSSAPGAGQSALARTVTLLTGQARALLSPGQAAPVFPSAVAAQANSATQNGPGTQAAQPSTGAASPPPAPLPDSPAGLAAALAASGSQRIADATEADGGMARLLAAVGTAQLLQASSLAAATGVPVPPNADPVPPQLSGSCPGPVVSASPASGGVTVAQALEAAVRTELQSVYGYQLALTRLGGEPAKAAAGQLARHEALLRGAESLSLRHCVSPPPPEAGYGLAPSFFAAPGTGLAGLETSALPVYGDLVALSEGETRQWAISALLETARGAAAWGAQPGPLPGLSADVESLPPLPDPSTPTPDAPAPTPGR